MEMCDFLNMTFPSEIVYNNEMYFFIWNNTIFMKMNLSNGEIHYVLDYENEPCLTGQTDLMICEKDSIYGITFDGKVVIKYSFQEKKFYKIDINYLNKKWDNFAAFEMFDNHLYIFPQEMDNVIIIDIDTKEQLTDKNNYYGKICNISFHESVRVNQYIWMYSEQSSQIVKFGFVCNSWEIVDLGDILKGCINIVEEQESKFIILGTDNCIYEWNEEKSLVKLIWKCPDEYTFYRCFNHIINTSKYYYLLPCYGNEIIKIEKETMQYEKYVDYPNDFNYLAPKEFCKFYRKYETDDKIYFGLRSANYVLAINKVTGQISWIEPLLPQEKEKIQYYREIHKQSLFYEQELQLSSYIQVVDLHKKPDNQLAHCGKEIYDYIKEEKEC